MSYNKCPYDLDIELWQLMCDEMDFKSQNYLLVIVIYGIS